MQHGTRDNKRCSKGQLCLLLMSAGLTLGQGPSPLRCKAAGTFEMNSSIEMAGPRSLTAYIISSTQEQCGSSDKQSRKKKSLQPKVSCIRDRMYKEKMFFFSLAFCLKIFLRRSYAECKEAFSTATSEQSTFISLHPSRCSRVLAAFRAHIISFLRQTGLSSS